MDNWFKDLFDIVKKQNDPMKLELLMPKIYSEFDILVRDRDIFELKEIFNYINSSNFFNTTDPKQNEKIKLECEQEILFRLVLLDDFSMLNKKVDELISNDKPHILNMYLDSWKHKSFIYDYIKNRINSIMPIQTDKDISNSRNKKGEKPIEKKKPEIKKEKLIKKKKVETTNIIKKENPIETKKEIQKEKPIEVIKPELKKPFIRINLDEDDDEPLEVIEEIKEKIPKKIAKKSVIQDLKKGFEKKDNSLDLIDIIIEKYPIIVSKDRLLNLTNPILAFNRIVVEFIDSDNRDIDFFIEFFNLCITNGFMDLVHFIAKKSQMLRHVASFNIAFLNEPDIDKCKKLLLLLKDEDIDYIKISLNELTLLMYVDDLYQREEITNNIIIETKKIARFIPKLTDTYLHTESINFFVKNILSPKTRTIDMTNVNHLYWSMILATYLGIYVFHAKESDYIECMETVTEVSLQLSIHIEDQSIKKILKELALTYIRKIYKAGITSPNYDSWWVRQVDDLRDSKIECLSKLEEITKIDLNY